MSYHSQMTLTTYLSTKICWVGLWWLISGRHLCTQTAGRHSCESSDLQSQWLSSLSFLLDLSRVQTPLVQKTCIIAINSHITCFAYFHRMIVSCFTEVIHVIILLLLLKFFSFLADSKHECIERFGKQPNARILHDDDQLCTTEYSRIVPLEDGEVW